MARAGGCAVSVRTMAGSGKQDTASVRRVRQACQALPDVRERVSHGEPTWFAGGGKAFAMFADHHHDDRVAVWVAAPDGAQGRLVSDDADRYFVPPYVGGRGWVGIRLDVPEVDWGRVEQVLHDAYRTVASKTLLRLLDRP
jgi:hypothetical protein